MPEDPFGMPYWHPTKNGGFEFFGTDLANQDNFEDSGNGTFVDNNQFNMVTDGPTSCFITRNPGFTETDAGCNEDFGDNESRGFAYKSTDLRDIEMKMIVDIDGGAHGFSISGPTGRHKSNSSPCCGGNAYMVSFEYDENPSVFRFRKEMWHVSYHDDPKTGQFTTSTVPFKVNNHGWFGIGYVRYNKPDGVSSGKDSVILEMWVNPDPTADKENWIKIKETEDKGGWGNDGGECGGDSDQILTWGGVKFRMKSNDTSGSIKIKNLSLREIDPFGVFSDPGGGGDGGSEIPPVEQPPQEIVTLQGTFKTQWDVNTVREQSQCAGVGVGGGGGGETGHAIFYELTEANSDASKDLIDNSKIAQEVTSSVPSLGGNLLNQFDIPLKKTGTISGTVNAKIWSSSGSVIYISPTTFDDADLTTSFVEKIFDFSANTHTIVMGDKVGIEHAEGTSSDFITCEYLAHATTTYPGKYTQYDSSNGWVQKDRELCCTMWS